MTAPTTVRIYKPVSWTLIASSLLIVSLILVSLACKPKAHLHEGQVHGFVVTEFANVAGVPAEQIAVPDLSVYLKHTTSGKRTAAVTTNALGHFATGEEKPGTYYVCVEANGFVPACDPKVTTISSRSEEHT